MLDLFKTLPVAKPEAELMSVSQGSSRGMDSTVQFTNWSETLAGMAEELHQLASSTEGEFLSIGAHLHDFYARAGAISHLSSEVVDQVVGEEVHTSISGLASLIDRMREYLDEAERDAVKDCDALGNVLHLLDEVSEPLGGFKKINKVLRMLGISTKIESARLGTSAAGFDTLAEDVANLSVQVLDKSETILTQKEHLSSTIRETLVKVEKIEAEQRTHVLEILRKTSESLVSLREINNRCTDLASVVAAVSAEVSCSISEVVTSMQFHDIVRQQIEHVQTALDELRVRIIADLEVNPAIRGGQDLVVETGDICELQSAQLRQASDDIQVAVSSIIENLSSIATKESHTSAKTRDMAGVADQAGSSFFSDMEHGLERVAVSLADNAEANRNISQAMTTVAGTVGEIVAYVGDIENIGEEIELIAMNAQIKAARTGEEGAALGVLAEAIQRLSVEAQQQTGTVSATLRSVTDTTEQLFRGGDDDSKSLEHDVEVMVSELHILLETLRHLNETLISRVTALEREVSSLSADIESTISSITVHEKMVAGLSKVICDLDLLVEETSALVPPDTLKGRTERLKELATRYTMHSERKVHASIAMVGDAGFAVEHAGGDEMDDNIELF